MQVEEDDRKDNSQDLLAAESPKDVRTGHGDPRLEGAHFADTVMVKGPAFLFAVNETILRPQAIMPLTSNATAFDWVICVAPYFLTSSSSPDHQPYTTHWMKAKGDMRMRRSRGC